MGYTISFLQIHTADGSRYGQGNLGMFGIVSFLMTHQCSAMCIALGMKPINIDEIKQNGTLPQFFPPT